LDDKAKINAGRPRAISDDHAASGLPGLQPMLEDCRADAAAGPSGREQMRPFRRMSRRTALAGMAQATGLAVAVSIGSSQALAEVSLRLTDHSPSAHPNAVAVAAMVERIAERTGGEVQIAHFPDSALGTSPEQADQVRRGVIDLGQVSPGPISAYNAAVGMLNTPYVFDDYEHVWRFFDDVGREWVTAELEKAGFVFLESFEWGFRAMTNNVRAIEGPDDVAGLRMRTPPELELQAVYEALGAFPQAINFQEVYVALASNTVDGQCNPLGTISSAKFYEVQDYLAITNHQYTASFLVANPESWAALSPEHQQIIREEARIAALEARAAVVDQAQQYIEQFEEAGMTVTRPDVAEFRARMEPAYARIKENRGAEVFDEVIGLAEEARQGG
jgi:tripartite ATP-independent transporter DctP family solute receptor